MSTRKGRERKGYASVLEREGKGYASVLEREWKGICMCTRKVREGKRSA